MATSDDVVLYLADAFPSLDVTGLEHGVLTVSVTSDSGEGVLVIVDIFDSVLTLTRPFALVSSMEAADALQGLRGAGLVQFSGSYAARLVVVMTNLTPSNIGAYVDSIANDSLRT
jgi:hypothetical protein